MERLEDLKITREEFAENKQTTQEKQLDAQENQEGLDEERMETIRKDLAEMERRFDERMAEVAANREAVRNARQQEVVHPEREVEIPPEREERQNLPAPRRSSRTIKPVDRLNLFVNNHEM